ncbi:MAG TPA: putative lipid II flippase FtsW [Candidatus Limnocylindrales bacterium]|jgi:cell division protein FtsW
MSLARPAHGLWRPSSASRKGVPATRVAGAAERRAPVKARAGTVTRERHLPDYSILVAVVTLAAVGILMVYSSSAMKAFLENDNTFAIVGPQIVWAALGVVVMLVTMRVDYRYLRLISVPAYSIAIVLLVLVFAPGLNRVVGGSARWLTIGPLPAVHPAEFAKLALIIYLAHWMARRGSAIRTFRGGILPFLLIVAPILALVFREPDLGTTAIIGLASFTMLFVAGVSLWRFAILGLTALGSLLVAGLRGYQMDRIQTWLNPWADPTGKGFHTIQGLIALGLGGAFGAGLGESRLAGGLFLPNASNDFIFAIIGEEFGFIGAVVVVGLFLVLGYAGIKTALGAPDTFGALLAAGITAWLCLQAFVNIAVVVALVPVTGITLPFISAGGSSLTISFAAAGILLSISRETIERGTWNDASADRGRGHGRTHLPGSRRRSIAPRSSGRP